MCATARLALLLWLCVAAVESKPGCTDVLEGCCTDFGRDCDFIPYSSMTEGLLCLPPTGSQCAEMYVQCSCPVNGAPIDNWQDPCVPASATEQRWNTGAGALEAFDAVYLFDDAAGLCVTCEQWTTTQNVSTGEPYQVGDFACVAGSSVQLEDGTAGVSPIHFDCADGDVGTRSGLACPAGAVEDAAPEALVFAEEAGLDCGDHGEMTTVHGHETCHCPPATNAETGEDISCWQTNRERSNRWPNGNIKVYCTVGLCDFDNTGAPVQVGLVGASYETEQVLGPIANLAKSLGVSPLAVYGCFAILAVVVLCVLYDLTCGKESNTQTREHLKKPPRQRRTEKKSAMLGVALDPDVYADLQAKARVAKEQYKDAWADGMTEWDALTPKERKVIRKAHRDGKRPMQFPNPMVAVENSPKAAEPEEGVETM